MSIQTVARLYRVCASRVVGDVGQSCVVHAGGLLAALALFGQTPVAEIVWHETQLRRWLRVARSRGLFLPRAIDKAYQAGDLALAAQVWKAGGK